MPLCSPSCAGWRSSTARPTAGTRHRCAGTFDQMPAHTPRAAVVAAANQAREAKADLIVTVGGGSITDGAKAVQLCLANDVSDIEGIDRIRTRGGEEPALKPPMVRQISVPTTIAGGEFSHIAGVTDERTHIKQMLRHALTVPRATISCLNTGSTATALAPSVA